MALPVGVVVNVSEVGLVDVLMGVLRSVLVDVGVLVRDMLVLMGGVRVRVSHAGMLVPGSKLSIWASARSSVSCTKSSARSILPHSEMAKARRLGTVARTWSRIAGSSFMRLAFVLSFRSFGFRTLAFAP